MINKSWPVDILSYTVACAGSMSCDEIGLSVGKSGEAVFKKLRKIGYIGKLQLDDRG